MAHGPKFSSAKLQSDGTVEVTGPFKPEPGEPDKPALVAFYLVQGSTKVDGEGRWMPGDTEWTGTAGSSGLQAGPAHGRGACRRPTQRPARVPNLQLVQQHRHYLSTNAE